jgi:stearoyl-CoA desaturase (delta-9 desaturase)
MFHIEGAVERRLSLLLLILVHSSCLLVFAVGFRWSLVALALTGYVIRMWAITAGYHRYFSHRAFKTTRAFQFLLGCVGATSMQNGPLWWASWHRRHHKDSDGPRDPHSPVQRGFWYAHMGWALDCKVSDKLDLSNVRDLTGYRELVLLDDHKWLPIVVYIAACYGLAGWAGVVWGFSVSTVLLYHCTLFINSLGHVWGSQRYATGDQSRNNPFLAVITLGEGWHNNHHHCMSSARQGFFWWEVDASYYTLKALSMARVVWDVREPSAAAVRGPLVAPVVRAKSNGRSAECPGPAAASTQSAIPSPTP